MPFIETTLSGLADKPHATATSESKNIDLSLDVVLVGDKGAGKSSLLNILSGSSRELPITNGMEQITNFYNVSLGEAEKRVKVNVWNDASDEKPSIKNAALVVVVFDLYNETSFLSAKQYVEDNYDQLRSKMILIGNYHDEASHSKDHSLVRISNTFAKKYGLDYHAISHIKGVGPSINSIFERAITHACRRILLLSAEERSNYTSSSYGNVLKKLDTTIDTLKSKEAPKKADHESQKASDEVILKQHIAELERRLAVLEAKLNEQEQTQRKSCVIL